jgi:hypothetical protein
VNLGQLFCGGIGGWWWVTLLFAGISVMGCLGWWITGCLPSVISFVGHEHLLGGYDSAGVNIDYRLVGNPKRKV